MTLNIKGLNAYYGDSHILRDLSLTITPGEILCLFGRNGAGKTTTVKAIMGQVKRTGKITLQDTELTTLEPHQIPKQGIGYVPQGRRLFAELTVQENLQIGLMTRKSTTQTQAKLLDHFPALQSRLKQTAGTLSGGEQQMLAMARALSLDPKLLLLDEPTEGLMPSMIATIRNTVQTLRDQGIAILLIEQRIEAILPIADRVAFIENGEIKQTVASEILKSDTTLLTQYIGISS